MYFRRSPFSNDIRLGLSLTHRLQIQVSGKSGHQALRVLYSVQYSMRLGEKITYQFDRQYIERAMSSSWMGNCFPFVLSRQTASFYFKKCSGTSAEHFVARVHCAYKGDEQRGQLVHNLRFPLSSFLCWVRLSSSRLTSRSGQHSTGQDSTGWVAFATRRLFTL